MSNLKEIPDHLKKRVDQYQGTDNLIDHESIPRVSIRGSKFRLKIGEEETVIKGDFEVIILGVSPEVGHSHTYYKGNYQPGSNESPDCTSMEGVVPDSWIDKPQSENCATCMQNAWGSAKSMSGGKSKACKQGKTVYLILKKDLKEAKPVIYGMGLSFLSLKGLTSFGKQLAGQNLPPYAVITTLVFDDDSSVPKVLFKITDYVSEQAANLTFKLAEKKEWIWEPDSNQTSLPDQSADKPALIEHDPAPEKTADDQGGKKKKKKKKKESTKDLVHKWE